MLNPRVHRLALQGQIAALARPPTFPNLLGTGEFDVTYGLMKTRTGFDITVGTGPVSSQTVTAMARTVIHGLVFEVGDQSKKLPLTCFY